jgi:hypothetical protein
METSLVYYYSARGKKKVLQFLFFSFCCTYNFVTVKNIQKKTTRRFILHLAGTDSMGEQESFGVCELLSDTPGL